MDSPPEPLAGCERTLRDAALVGDADAWRTLFEGAFRALDGYILWRCGGRRDWADEILQESWLIAVDRLGNFEPSRASFVAWMRGIAANVIRNHLRRERRRQGHERNGSPEVIEPDYAESVERQRRVMQALAALPEHYERILQAKYLDRLSVAAIAAAEGQTYKAVESILARAREAFREAYEAEE